MYSPAFAEGGWQTLTQPVCRQGANCEVCDTSKDRCDIGVWKGFCVRVFMNLMCADYLTHCLGSYLPSTTQWLWYAAWPMDFSGQYQYLSLG